MKDTFIVFIFLIGFQFCQAQTASHLRSTLGVGGSSKEVTLSGKSYWVQQSIGQSGVIGSFRNANVQLFQGFIQPFYSLKVVNTQSSKLAVVYPNPFNRKISIQFIDEASEKIGIRITDILGREVFQKEFNRGTLIEFDPGVLSPGQFILSISKGGQQQYVKLMRE